MQLVSSFNFRDKAVVLFLYWYDIIFLVKMSIYDVLEENDSIDSMHLQSVTTSATSLSDR